jgi:Ni/Co efflux regulator RcnB
MRKIIFAALMAATILPSAAFAQNNDQRPDRQDVRRDQGNDQRNGQGNRHYDGQRYGRDDHRDFRNDHRDARNDARDFRRDDWRSYRNTNRNIYARGNWNADFRYRAFSPGIRITSGYYAPRYYINDYARYRLPRPGFNQRWVRHYNDVLLVDVRGGRVVDVIRNFYL